MCFMKIRSWKGRIESILDAAMEFAEGADASHRNMTPVNTLATTIPTSGTGTRCIAAAM